MKRAFDLSLSLLGIALLWPLVMLAAVWIKLDSPGPVFFRQERVGRHGVLFRIWKLRTMGAAAAGAAGAEITVADDARITRVGRLLRRWKIDELPQLLNVLDGTMSLVGPRPEVARYVAFYNPEQRAVLGWRPGLTDPVALAFRDEEVLLAQAADPERLYVDQIMPAKIAWSLAYGRSASVRSDLGVIVATLKSIVTPAGTRRPPAEAGLDQL